ncbi:NNP family nitrate/nitrite transporter-like MFS transporter [Idiomarina aquatica]|uniref:NNP family nitrate/nitrite transporter-like MFS transporter n=2 Tax=Idiomarina aquatica TaxID=1327752 RepID=A0A4R6P344_9GAMM|nr:NNP family nitrate/nitrite transporter-like MFS transporter [Idiomarina aquatica]
MTQESRATWLQLLIGMSYWASWPIIIVLMYQTSRLAPSDAFLLLGICGGSGVLARVVGSFMSPMQSATIARFHNLIMASVAALGCYALVDFSLHYALYFAVAVSGCSGLLYARAFDLSLVGSRADLSGEMLPSAWVVGIILVATFLAYLIVPLVVMVHLPLSGAAHEFVLSSGNLFIRRAPGSVIWLASFPLFIMALFLVSGVKQWCLPDRRFQFLTGKRQSLSPELLRNRHFWFIGILYNLTLGTFIGVSFVLPFVLEIVFGYSTLMLVWMAPFLAILSRPLGHWLGRLVGGTLITQVCLLLMAIFAALAAKQFELTHHQHDMRYFDVLFTCMLGLVISAAMANGSVVVTLHKVFPVAYINRALTWMGSFAMLGALYLPLRFAVAWQPFSFDQVMTEVALFFVAGFIFNYVIYLRRHGDFYNP